MPAMRKEKAVISTIGSAIVTGGAGGIGSAISDQASYITGTVLDINGGWLPC